MLPRAVWVCEVHLSARALRESLMLRHLATLVVRHQQATLRIDPVENHAKALDCSLSTTICNLSQGHKQTCSFNKRADSRSIATTIDEVTLPMAGYHPLTNLWQSLMNADHIRNLASTILTACARTTNFTSLPQGSKCIPHR